MTSKRVYVLFTVIALLGPLLPPASAGGPRHTPSAPLTGTAAEYALSPPARELPMAIEVPAHAVRPPRTIPSPLSRTAASAEPGAVQAFPPIR